MSYENEMDFASHKYQAKLKYLFIVTVDGIPTYLCTKATRPQFNVAQVEYKYLNTKRYSAGRVTYQPISLTVVDAYTPSGAQAVMSWARQQFQPTSGRAGYADNYFKDMKIHVLGPSGDVQEQWILQDCFITATNFGDLSYQADNQVMQIELTIRYNKATLNY